MEDLCVIGAGPAGLTAAIHAAQNRARVLVLETNTTAGRKLLLTGGGRCNFTHVGGPEDLAKAFGKPGRFLRQALYEFPPAQVREFFQWRELPSTVEANGCVFPISDQAADVRNVLVAEAAKLGVRIRYQLRVDDVAAGSEGFVIRTAGGQVHASRVILATGGLSWPQTGSTGDGYRFAAQLGHTVIAPKPALVPLVVRETWMSELAGVSVANVRLRATVDAHPVVSAGNMLFTQRGIGGPAAQDLSRHLTDALFEGQCGIPVEIDLLPDLDEVQLDRQLQQGLQAQPKKTVANVLSECLSLPRQLSQTLCLLAGCARDGQAGQLPGPGRRQLVRTITRLPLCVTGTESIAKATVTRGGVSRDQIDPKTLESKVRPGLFFAGEVIDLDGPCGGYNLQMCWSTGALAGRSAAQTRPDIHLPA
ncbi:MAG: NAD(P)/FAD-dependent oxidoreductase [Phycisphaerae bacterium]|nr:NAD(P)/FAD-dependent oxidoreductase [Phycisphaerae bacterium]